MAGLLGAFGGSVAAQNPKQPPVKPKAAPAPKAAPKAPVPAPKPPPEPPRPQQWKVVSRYVADGVETLTTVYAGGKRQRVELPGGTSIITQCDLGRAVQVNERAKAYAVLPFNAPAASTANPDPPKPGASVLVRTTSTDTGKEQSKLAVDVTALTHESLSTPLFEPPAGFTALPDAEALAVTARRIELEELGTTPKLAGMTRIGVAPPGDRSGKSFSADAMRTRLLEELNTRPFEAIPLSSGTPEEQQAEARKKECDYVVRAELGSLTTSTPGRVGGLVRRASGGGTPTEIHEAGVALELVPVAAAAKPRKLTASAKTGAFTWRRAVGLARFAGKLYFGMTGGMMTTLMSSSGTGGGGPLGGGDPTVNALMMLLGPSAGKEPSDDLTTPDAVVAAAFQKAASDVMKDLQAKPK